MTAKERKVIRGIVLRAVDTKEADKILTVLTGSRGSWLWWPRAPGAGAAG